MSINSGVQQIVPYYDAFKGIKVLTPRGANALIGTSSEDTRELIREMLYILNGTIVDYTYIEKNTGEPLLKEYGIPVFLINASYAIKMGHVEYEGMSNLAIEYDTVLTKTGLEHLIKKIAQTLTSYTTIFDEKSIREIEMLLETAQDPDIKYIIERVESLTDLVGRKTYIITDTPKRDENGEIIKDENGNPIYETEEVEGAEYFNEYSGKNIASGYYSHAEGLHTKAEGDQSHAEGFYTLTEGKGSHAEGYSAWATGNYSHAEGTECQAGGNNSHAEGESTLANGEASHSEGKSSWATGKYSHAEGFETVALGDDSHTEGKNSEAWGEGSHTEGYHSKSSVPSYIIKDIVKINNDDNYKYKLTLKNNYSHYTLNIDTVKNIDINFSIRVFHNNITFVSGIMNIDSIENINTNTESTMIVHIKSLKNGERDIDFDETYINKPLLIIDNDIITSLLDLGTHSEGYNTVAIGRASHAEGYCTFSSNLANHSEGQQTRSIGLNGSHAEGFRTEASNSYSHAEGSQTVASGSASHAEGYQTVASGQYSHASGQGTIASATGQTVVGKYNKEDDDALFIVGNGTSKSNRSNALVVKKDGKIEGDLGYKIGDIKYSYNNIWAKDEKWLKANGKITIRESEYKELFDILGGESKPIYVEGNNYIKSLSNIFVSDGGKLYEWQGESNKYKIYSNHTIFADNNTTAISTLSKFPEGICAYKIGNTLFWIGINPTTNEPCLCYKNYNFNTINYKELPNITILGAYTPQGKDSEGVICVYGEETSISTVRYTKYYLSIFSCNNNNLLIEKTVATSDFLKGSVGAFDLIYLSDDIIIYEASDNISKILYHKFGTNSLDTWDPSYPVSKNQSIAEIDNYLFIIPYQPYGSYGSYCYMYKKDSKLVFVTSGYISGGSDTDIQCHILGLYKDEDDDSYKCIVFYSAEEETSTGGYEYYGAMSGYKFYLDSDNKWVGEEDDDLVGWDKNELYKKCNIPTKLVTSLKNIENQEGMIYLNSKSSFYNNATCFQYTYDETTQNFSAASSLSGTTILPNLTPPSSNTNIQCEAYIKAK